MEIDQKVKCGHKMDNLINVTAAILFYNGRLLIAKRKEEPNLEGLSSEIIELRSNLSEHQYISLE